MAFRDSPADLARDLIDDIGWWPAVRYMAARLMRSQSWREAGRGLKLLAAVVVG